MNYHSFLMGSEVPSLDSWPEVICPSKPATFAAP